MPDRGDVVVFAAYAATPHPGQSREHPALGYSASSRHDDPPDRHAMKTIRGIATCVATPNLVDESMAGVTPTEASGILIVVDGRTFDSSAYGSEGRAYLTGLGEGIQGALTGVPTQVVELDMMKFVDPIPPALAAMHPSHLVRLFTASDLRRNDTPVSATWQMNVSNVTITSIPATGEKPEGTRYTVKPIYKARADGDACLDTDSLAKKCGAAMGRMLGDTMRAAHVMRIGVGIADQSAN